METKIVVYPYIDHYIASITKLLESPNYTLFPIAPIVATNTNLNQLMKQIYEAHLRLEQKKIILRIVLFQKLYSNIKKDLTLIEVKGWLLINITVMYFKIKAYERGQHYFYLWRMLGEVDLKGNFCSILGEPFQISGFLVKNDIYDLCAEYCTIVSRSASTQIKTKQITEPFSLVINYLIAYPYWAYRQLQKSADWVEFSKKKPPSDCSYFFNFIYELEETIYHETQAIKYEHLSQNHQYIKVIMSSQPGGRSIPENKKYKVKKIVGQSQHMKRQVLIDYLKNGEIFKLFNPSYILQDLVFDPEQSILKQNNLSEVFGELYNRIYLLVVGNLSIPFQIADRIQIVQVSSQSSAIQWLSGLKKKGTIFMVTNTSLSEVNILNDNNIKAIYCINPDQQPANLGIKNIEVYSSEEQCFNELEHCLERYMNRYFGYANMPNFSKVTGDKTKALNTRLIISWMLEPHNTLQSINDFLTLIKASQEFSKYKTDILKLEQDTKNLQSWWTKKLPIRWYSKNSFFYRILNRGLRSCSSPLHLAYFRYPTMALYWNISQLHFEQKVNGDFKKGLVCYRGCYLTQSQFKQMNENKGSYIQMEGFLSTSVDQNIANQFGEYLLQIHVQPIQPSERSQGHFANISKYSEYFGEEEIVFNPLNYFKIISVHKTKIRLELVQVSNPSIHNERSLNQDLLKYIESYTLSIKLQSNQGTLFYHWNDQTNFYKYYTHKFVELARTQKYQETQYQKSIIKRLGMLSEEIIENSYNKNLLKKIYERLKTSSLTLSEFTIQVLRESLEKQYSHNFFGLHYYLNYLRSLIKLSRQGQSEYKAALDFERQIFQKLLSYFHEYTYQLMKSLENNGNNSIIKNYHKPDNHIKVKKVTQTESVTQEIQEIERSIDQIINQHGSIGVYESVIALKIRQYFIGLFQTGNSSGIIRLYEKYEDSLQKYYCLQGESKVQIPQYLTCLQAVVWAYSDRRQIKQFERIIKKKYLKHRDTFYKQPQLEHYCFQIDTRIAINHHSKQQFEESLAVFDRYIESGYNILKLMKWLAICFHSAKQYGQTCQVSRNNPMGFFKAATSYCQLGKCIKSIPYFQKHIKFFSLVSVDRLPKPIFNEMENSMIILLYLAEYESFLLGVKVFRKAAKYLYGNTQEYLDHIFDIIVKLCQSGNDLLGEQYAKQYLICMKAFKSKNYEWKIKHFNKFLEVISKFKTIQQLKFIFVQYLIHLRQGAEDNQYQIVRKNMRTNIPILINYSQNSSFEIQQYLNNVYQTIELCTEDQLIGVIFELENILAKENAQQRIIRSVRSCFMGDMNKEGYVLWRYCSNTFGVMKLHQMYQFLEDISNFQAFSEFNIELCVQLGELYLIHMYNDDYELFREKISTLAKSNNLVYQISLKYKEFEEKLQNSSILNQRLIVVRQTISWQQQLLKDQLTKYMYFPGKDNILEIMAHFSKMQYHEALAAIQKFRADSNFNSFGHFQFESYPQVCEYLKQKITKNGHQNADEEMLYRFHQSIKIMLTQCSQRPSFQYISILINLFKQAIQMSFGLSLEEPYLLLLQAIKLIKADIRTIESQQTSFFKDIIKIEDQVAWNYFNRDQEVKESIWLKIRTANILYENKDYQFAQNQLIEVLSQIYILCKEYQYRSYAELYLAILKKTRQIQDAMTSSQTSVQFCNYIDLLEQVLNNNRLIKPSFQIIEQIEKQKQSLLLIQ